MPYREEAAALSKASPTNSCAGSIHIDGRLTGDSGGLTVRVDDLQLEAAARAIPGRVSLPAGVMSLQAHLTGTFDKPALDATAHVELEFLGDLSARVFGHPRAWNASATWVTLVEDSLRVTASAPARRWVRPDACHRVPTSTPTRPRSTATTVTPARPPLPKTTTAMACARRRTAMTQTQTLHTSEKITTATASALPTTVMMTTPALPW